MNAGAEELDLFREEADLPVAPKKASTQLCVLGLEHSRVASLVVVGGDGERVRFLLCGGLALGLWVQVRTYGYIDANRDVHTNPDVYKDRDINSD